MTELEAQCRKLKVPLESQAFCDFVLVFDEIVADDLNDAKNKNGCCSCCRTSYKELEECLKVGDDANARGFHATQRTQSNECNDRI